MNALGRQPHNTPGGTVRLVDTSTRDGNQSLWGAAGLTTGMVEALGPYLERAGLVVSRREGREVRYAARFDAMRDLLTFVTEDCCGGRPEICAGLPGAVREAAR